MDLIHKGLETLCCFNHKCNGNIVYLPLFGSNTSKQAEDLIFSSIAKRRALILVATKECTVQPGRRVQRWLWRLVCFVSGTLRVALIGAVCQGPQGSVTADKHYQSACNPQPGLTSQVLQRVTSASLSVVPGRNLVNRLGQEDRDNSLASSLGVGNRVRSHQVFLWHSSQLKAGPTP